MPLDSMPIARRLVVALVALAASEAAAAAPPPTMEATLATVRLGPAGLAVSPRSPTLATAERDRVVLRELSTLAERRAIIGPKTSRILSIAFAAKRPVLAVAYHGYPAGPETTSIKLFDVATGRKVRALDVAWNHANSLAFTGDDRVLTVGTDVSLWRPFAGAVEDLELRVDKDGGQRGTISADGTWIAVLGHEPPIVHTSEPDGTRAYLTGKAPELRVYRAGKLVERRSAVMNLVTLAFSSDGGRLLLAGRGGGGSPGPTTKGVALFAVPSFKRVAHRDEHDVSAAAWSMDDSLVVAATTDGSVRVLRGHDLSQVQELPNQGAVQQLALSADARRVVVYGADQGLRVWKR